MKMKGRKKEVRLDLHTGDPAVNGVENFERWNVQGHVFLRISDSFIVVHDLPTLLTSHKLFQEAVIQFVPGL